MRVIYGNYSNLFDNSSDPKSFPRSGKSAPTCEAPLALLLAAGDGQELVGEQVQSGGTPVRIGLEAAQDEGLGLQGHGLGDLGVDLEHSHLQRSNSSLNPDIQELHVWESAGLAADARMFPVLLRRNQTFLLLLLRNADLKSRRSSQEPFHMDEPRRLEQQHTLEA